jgi:hypothetical protein
MKKILLCITCYLFSLNSFCQSINITEVLASPTTNGINVTVKAVSGNGAGYLSHSYTTVGNTINLDVCYWFNITLPVLFFENDFFIPLGNSGNYTLNVYAKNSSSTISCDNFSTTDVETVMVSYLSNEEFIYSKALISPNPFLDNFEITTEHTISNYSIIDFTGKTIVSTYSKSELDNQSLQLSTGIYFLNLDFDNGQKANYKLVKK